MKLVRQSVELFGEADCLNMARALGDNRGRILARTVEKIARTCYKSEAKRTADSAEPFVRRLIKNGHEAMIEHVGLTLKIITSRAIANEIVRHRMASYAQESTRYCDYKDEIEFVFPSGLDEQTEAEFVDMCNDAEYLYKRLRYNNIAPQIARDILPLALKTELIMTANMREWRHFLKLRTAPDAHPMMRELAGMVLNLFRERVPVFVEDIEYDTAK